MKESALAALKSYDISPSQSRVGLVTFGEEAYIYLKLKDGSSYDTIRMTLDALPRVGGERKLQKVLQRLYTFGFAGGRAEAKKVLMLYTTGKPSKSETEISVIGNNFKEDGIGIITIGVGNGISQDDFINISGHTSQIIIIDHHDHLVDIIGDIEQVVGGTVGKLSCCYVLLNNMYHTFWLRLSYTFYI